MRIGDDGASSALKQSLTLLSRRQQATLHNLANVDTPGYKAKTVSFKSELAKATGAGLAQTATNPAHFRGLGETPGAQIEVSEAPNTTFRNDGNSVDVDRELASLAETTITYSAVAQQVSARLALMRHVITEGRS